MTGIPVQQKTWNGILPNQRVGAPFVSLIATMGGVITGHTNQMIAKGFTCAGSSNGVTGAMNTVNLCTAPAGFAVRGATAGTSQSWIVLNHANGSQTCFAYQGASDDIARVSFSPGGLFIAAGTPTQQPTATDELVASSAISVIDATASLDRVFTTWVDSTHNHWRLAVFRQGALVGRLLGAEPFDSTPLVGVSCTNNMWVFSQQFNFTQSVANIAGAYSLNSVGGLCKTTGNPQTLLGGYISLAHASTAAMDNILLTANGSLFAYLSIGLFSLSSGCIGLIGFRFDWYRNSDNQICGALTPGLNWVVLNNSVTGAPGILWPWDGTTTSCVTS